MAEVFKEIATNYIEDAKKGDHCSIDKLNLIDANWKELDDQVLLNKVVNYCKQESEKIQIVGMYFEGFSDDEIYSDCGTVPFYYNGCS